MVTEYSINNNQGSRLENGVFSKNKSNLSKRHYINFGEEDQMEITGYAFNKLKSLLTVICYILSLGLLRLIFHWYPQLQLYATHSITALESAEKILITDNYKGKMRSYYVKKVELLKANNNNKNKHIKERFPESQNDQQQHDDKTALLTVYLCDGTKKKLPELRLIRHKKLIYIWDNEKEKFLKLSGLDKGVKNSELHLYQGYNYNEQNLKRIVYGNNIINVPVQSITTLLVLEALTPFYIFQLFSLIVWLAEYYYYYTIAILIMSIFGISTSIIQTRKNQQNLKGTVLTSDKIFVNRTDDVFEEIPTTDLVPGDIIVIPTNGCVMQCDAVLLNGNCIVNESMLTGESVPVIKTALPRNDKFYDVKEDSNHTLFCGTKIIQTRYHDKRKVLAIVIRTGYLTTKGQLVRSILYPPPADFKFDQDSYKFIMILTVIAILGFIYTVFSKYSRNIAPLDILIKALDLITIAIPPALPAAMTVGKLYALNRLKKQQIFCINSRVINVSGSIDCVCFDKTGTLTEDGLDMWGVVPIINQTIHEPIKNIPEMSSVDSLLFQGMLTCHSLTIINGELCGDPLDVKMFESTSWLLEETHNTNTHTAEDNEDLHIPIIVKPPQPNHQQSSNNQQIAIIHQYQFTSNLQRMSVIVKNAQKPYYEIFCKGSPEMILSLCQTDTIPENILNKLKEFTEQGYRVIGMATKILPESSNLNHLNQLHREDIECNLTFIGLIVLENRLKPETSGVIDELHQAGMKLIMITGDNILTAVSVAKECGIIQSNHTIIDVIVTKPTRFDLAKINFHLINNNNNQTSKSNLSSNNNNNNNNNNSVKINIDNFHNFDNNFNYQLIINGNNWLYLNQYFPKSIRQIILKNCVVFARMSGQQKQQLVEELQNLGYYVAMCGDGANDCGALKAAHVGISLSDYESSVASPFTSKIPNITCTKKIISEGRAALVTSFGIFKMMLCYSLTEFISVIILYAIDTNLTSIQFLFIDICLILNFATFFGNSQASKKLYNKTPMKSLLNLIPLTSMILFMLTTIIFQLISYYYIQTYDWFEPFEFNSNNTTNYISYENYSIFTISMFQYIIMAIIFTKGQPYRQSIYRNYLFLLSIIVMITICCYLTMFPNDWLIDLFELKLPPKLNGKLTIIVIALINFLICLLIEDYLIDKFLLDFIEKRKIKKLEKLRLKQNFDYQFFLNQISNNSDQSGLINDSFCNDDDEETESNRKEITTKV